MVYLIEHQGATAKTYSGKLLHDPNMMDRTEVKQTMVRISTNLEEEKKSFIVDVDENWHWWSHWKITILRSFSIGFPGNVAIQC